MCCLFGNNCRNDCPRNRSPFPRGGTGIVGPRGPQGPQGPRGETGATGASGTNNALYAGNNAATNVESNAVIPIALLTATNGNTMTVSNNAVNLPEAGSYLVSYYVNGSVAEGDFSTSLYLNGAQISGETIVLAGTAGNASSASKTVIVSTDGAATLSLVNTSANAAALTGASITVLKTA